MIAPKAVNRIHTVVVRPPQKPRTAITPQAPRQDVAKPVAKPAASTGVKLPAAPELTNTMIRRLLSDHLMVQRIPGLEPFSEFRKVARSCKCSNPKAVNSSDVQNAKHVLSNLGPTQKKIVKEFFNVERLKIPLRRPGQAIESAVYI